MILESLQVSYKGRLDLLKCTRIKPETLNFALNILLEKKLIQVSDKGYTVNQSMPTRTIRDLQDPKMTKYEIMDLINACIELKQIENSSFHMRKIYLNQQNLIFYKGIINQLETFLSSIKDCHQETSSQTFIFWGEANYGKIIDYCIEN